MPAAAPLARTTLILTPLAKAQVPQVASDLRNVVGIPSNITVSNVSRSEGGRLLAGASFSFTVLEDQVKMLTAKTYHAMQLRYGESSAVRAEVWSVAMV